MSTPSKKKSDKSDAAVSIKSAGAAVSNKVGNPESPGKRSSKKDKDKDKESEKKSGKDDKGKKGILKKKGGGGRSKGDRNVEKNKKKKARAPNKKKKSLYEKFAQYLGFYVGKVTITDPMAAEAIQALDLQAWHLRRLRAKFDKIDIDGSGAIDYDEFFEAVNENRSPFTDKLFALIDLDGSGSIEFDEYIRVMATYCMFTKDEILRFCFECFDVDKSGTIDEKEFVELCKCINNANPAFPANFKRALEEFDVNEDGLIDYGEFLEIDRRYPLVLFPAFRLQDVMQENSLGHSTWLKVIENYEESRRVEEYKATHGGKAPPEKFEKTLFKVLFPCAQKEKVHIKVGKDMEDRHRQEAADRDEDD